MDIKFKLKENKAYIKSNYHVEEIGIFGSFVRGNLRQNSDIDVLVEFAEGYKDFFNYMRLKQYLQDLFGRKVDLVMKKAIKPRLKDRILSEVEYV